MVVICAVTSVFAWFAQNRRIPGFTVSDASAALVSESLSDLVTDFVTLQTSYTETLPSLNLAYDLSEDTIFRFGAAKTLTRPSVSDIRPSISFSSISAGNVVGRAGNPDLDPYTAWSFDFGIEHYIGDAGLIAINAFYKDVDGFVFSETLTDTSLAGVTFNELTLIDNARRRRNCRLRDSLSASVLIPAGAF